MTVPSDPHSAELRAAAKGKLRLGTRASPLARWQANWVAEQLAARGTAVELVPITTQGDVKTQPLGQIGGMGLFTKELQRALLAQEIDLAVHSLKDLPTAPVPGLTLAAVPEREETADVLVSPVAEQFDSLPQGARVGTGSIRRRAQLLHVRPDLEILEIRGNVETRLRKLDDGEYDAIVLAAAGLVRLGLTHRITSRFAADVMLPAIGQGALGIECRADDAASIAQLVPLDHSASHCAVGAERSLLLALRAGCLAPVGARTVVEGDQLTLVGVVLSGDGRRRIEASATAACTGAEQLGVQVAEALLAQGAAELVAAAHQGP
jgi:hydroxymethylbilane synthase